MKKSTTLIAILLITSLTSFGLTKDNSKNSFFVKSDDLHPNLDLTAGYVPKSTYNALKINFSANNIVLKRLGLYTSLEKGLNSEYLANTLGINVSVHKYAYLWTGFGLLADNGIFNTTVFTKFRKEFGFGIMPYKLTLVRIGWSVEVGPTITAGIKIPLTKHQNKN
ncbi:MAG: hypothetical protein PHP53_00860 [Prolixibacteraceae bacterium]|nr:hypothetical protein [Prolixibacteraceae bacterium]